MKKYLIIITLCILILDNSTLNSFNKINCKTRIIVDGGVGHELLINFSKNKLTFTTPKRIGTNNGFYIDNCKYYINWNTIEKNYSKYSIENKLKIKEDKLYYEGLFIKFPKNIKIREIWQAIKWNDWIIILGRTSETDNEANLTPPFFATELITFNIKKKKVNDIRYITFNPPSGNRIWILEPQ